MTDNATLLALGCVGGIVLALGVGVLLLSFSVGELRAMLRRWLDHK